MRESLATSIQKFAGYLADRLRGKSIIICSGCHRLYEKGRTCQAAPGGIYSCTPWKVYVRQWHLDPDDGVHYTRRKA